jgi:capsular exopolysaccharide synthesis family protein
MASGATQLEDLDGQAAPEQPPPGDEGESAGETFAQYWRLIRNYYWIVIITCAVGASVAYFYTQRQPEIYRTSAKIVFHQSQDNIFGKQIDRVEMMNTEAGWGFRQFWNTQKEVFRSRWFAERILKRDPAEDDGVDKPLLEYEKFLESEEDRDFDERVDAGIQKIKTAVSVELEPDSRVAKVTAETQDPKVAELIANRTANEYTDYTEEVQSKGLDKITKFFDERVSEKRTNLEKAQQKLQEFKQENNILSFSYEDRQNQTASSMASKTEQVDQIEKQLSDARSLLEQVRTLEEDDEQDERAIAYLVENESLKQMFQRESELETELARLKTEYLDEHPKVKAVARELEVVRDNIDEEIDKVKAGIQNRVNMLESQKSRVESQRASLKNQLLELDKLGADYQQLKNRKDNLQELYDAILQRASELDISSAYNSENIEILERARQPAGPVSPVLPFNLAIGLGLGAMLGLGGIVLIDALDTTIRSEEDLTQYTDKPILANLPELDESVLAGLETIGETPADTITHTAPKSSFAEGIKTLRTNLTFMSPDDPPETLLVTSPGPGEGKTISSINLAIAMAQSGSRTLLVDTDLRKPRIHKALGVEKDSGVSSLIRGETTLAESTGATEIEGLDIITSGEVPPNPSEMLHSERFHDLVEEMGAAYDRVIFDSPPLAAVSDALIISNMVDGALLVVEFGKTRRETFLRSLEQLQGIGAPLLGHVLNEVRKDGAGYGYGYSYYRYSYYQYGEEGEDEDRLAS